MGAAFAQTHNNGRKHGFTTTHRRSCSISNSFSDRIDTEGGKGRSVRQQDHDHSLFGVHEE